jgi:hypothetical protein
MLFYYLSNYYFMSARFEDGGVGCYGAGWLLGERDDLSVALAKMFV